MTFDEWSQQDRDPAHHMAMASACESKRAALLEIIHARGSSGDFYDGFQAGRNWDDHRELHGLFDDVHREEQHRDMHRRHAKMIADAPPEAHVWNVDRCFKCGSIQHSEGAYGSTLLGMSYSDEETVEGGIVVHLNLPCFLNPARSSQRDRLVWIIARHPDRMTTRSDCLVRVDGIAMWGPWDTSTPVQFRSSERAKGVIDCVGGALVMMAVSRTDPDDCRLVMEEGD